MRFAGCNGHGPSEVWPVTIKAGRGAEAHLTGTLCRVLLWW